MKWTADRSIAAFNQRRASSTQTRTDQSGLSLVELIIALAIISLIAGVTVVAIDQLLRSSRQANDQQYAISQLRQAEHFLSRDILMTWTIDTTDPDSFLLLTWNRVGENEEVTAHLVTYEIQGPTGAPGQLRRNELVNDSSHSSVVVAQDISGTAEWMAENHVLRVTLFASANGHEEMRVFDVKPRKTNIAVVLDE